jgi:hypothetical protein
MTPNARSAALLRQEGYQVDIVERWVVGANIHRDLYGIFDLLAVCEGKTLAVQTTTSDHFADRRRKVLESPMLPRVKAAGWVVEIHGWSQRAGELLIRRASV